MVEQDRTRRRTFLGTAAAGAGLAAASLAQPREHAEGEVLAIPRPLERALPMPLPSEGGPPIPTASTHVPTNCFKAFRYQSRYALRPMPVLWSGKYR